MQCRRIEFRRVNLRIIGICLTSVHHLSVLILNTYLHEYCDTHEQIYTYENFHSRQLLHFASTVPSEYFEVLIGNGANVALQVSKGDNNLNRELPINLLRHPGYYG